MSFYESIDISLRIFYASIFCVRNKWKHVGCRWLKSLRNHPSYLPKVLVQHIFIYWFVLICLCDCFFFLLHLLRLVERVSIDKSIEMIVFIIMIKTTLWRFSFHFISFGWLFIYLSLPLVAFYHFFNLVNVIFEMNIISHGFAQNGNEKRKKFQMSLHALFFVWRSVAFSRFFTFIHLFEWFVIVWKAYKQYDYYIRMPLLCISMQTL